MRHYLLHLVSSSFSPPSHFSSYSSITNSLYHILPVLQPVICSLADNRAAELPRQKGQLIIGSETAHCWVTHPLSENPFSMQTRSDRRYCREVAECPFHCGLVINVQRNNHTISACYWCLQICQDKLQQRTMMRLFPNLSCENWHICI